MTAETPSVFISYRRKDSSGNAGRVRDALRAAFGEGRVFYDVVAIRGGTRFSEQIRLAIVETDVVIVIIGSRWARRTFWRWLLRRSDWVRTEIERAAEQKKHLLPVLVDDSGMPVALALPPSIRFLSRLQAVPMRNDSWDNDIAGLIRTIQQLATTVPPPEPEQEAPVRSRLWPLYALVITAAMALTWVVGNQRPSPVPPVAPAPTPRPAESTAEIRSSVIQVSVADQMTTGFFITPDGYALTLLPDDIARQPSLIVRTITKGNLRASVVAHRQTELTLLKVEGGPHPFLDLALRDPAPRTSIQIVGVDAADLLWKGYASRVLLVDAGTITYERPEKTWAGVMGAPVIDLEDAKVVGMHFGAADTPGTQGEGRTLNSLELPDILKGAGIGTGFAASAIPPSPDLRTGRIHVANCYYQSEHRPSDIVTALKAGGATQVTTDERRLPANWNPSVRDTLLALKPHLIVIHYSCFQDKPESDPGGSAEGLKDFQGLLGAFAQDSSIRFVVYSRAFVNPASMNDLLAQRDLYPNEPGRRLFPMYLYPKDSFGSRSLDADQRLRCTTEWAFGGQECDAALPPNVWESAMRLRQVTNNR